MLSTGKHKTLDVTAKLETIKACEEINDSKSVTGRSHNLKARSAKQINISIHPYSHYICSRQRNDTMFR